MINKWFAVQASTFAPDSLARVKALMQHEAYDSTNPNRLRAGLRAGLRLGDVEARRLVPCCRVAAAEKCAPIRARHTYLAA